jgi:hypothetical protein
LTGRRREDEPRVTARSRDFANTSRRSGQDENMAPKTPDSDLFDRLRATGLRKRVARDLSSALGRANSTRASKAAQGKISDLRKLVEELEDRARGGPQKRSTAARKAAATRKLKAAKRSAAARKAARTRAKAG